MLHLNQLCQKGVPLGNDGYMRVLVRRVKRSTPAVPTNKIEWCYDWAISYNVLHPPLPHKTWNFTFIINICTYLGRLIAPNPPRPLYPELLPRYPRPRGALFEELIPGLLVRFGITYKCSLIRIKIFGFRAPVQFNYFL